MENRALSDPSPGGRQYFLKGKTEFIPKHNDGAKLPRLFLSLASLVATTPEPTLFPAQRLMVGVFVG